METVNKTDANCFA